MPELPMREASQRGNSNPKRIRSHLPFAPIAPRIHVADYELVRCTVLCSVLTVEHRLRASSSLFPLHSPIHHSQRGAMDEPTPVASSKTRRTSTRL